MSFVQRCIASGCAALLGLGASSAHAQFRQDLAPGRPSDVAQLVESKMLPLFDFNRASSIEVARNWRLASPVRQEAVSQFPADAAKFGPVLLIYFGAARGQNE